MITLRLANKAAEPRHPWSQITELRTQPPRESEAKRTIFGALHGGVSIIARWQCVATISSRRTSPTINGALRWRSTAPYVRHGRFVFAPFNYVRTYLFERCFQPPDGGQLRRGSPLEADVSTDKQSSIDDTNHDST
jgi:hypothetical protein